MTEINVKESTVVSFVTEVPAPQKRRSGTAIAANVTKQPRKKEDEEDEGEKPEKIEQVEIHDDIFAPYTGCPICSCSWFGLTVDLGVPQPAQLLSRFSQISISPGRMWQTVE